MESVDLAPPLRLLLFVIASRKMAASINVSRHRESDCGPEPKCSFNAT
jgi:hypothetical protein